MLGVGVALGGEQQLAAAELHFIELRALRVALHDAIEGSERGIRLAGGLVGARQLVEHLVVARIVGVGLEQRAVEADGFRALQIDGGHLLLEALHLAGIEVQVAQSPQRLGAQPGIGVLHLEEVAVILHGARAARARGRIGMHLDLAPAEIADGAARWCTIRGRALGGHAQRQQRAQRQRRGGREQRGAQSRGAHRGGSAGGGDASGGGGDSAGGGASGCAAGGLLRVASAFAARSYMVASAKRACTW